MLLFSACGIDKSYHEGSLPQLSYSLDTLTFDTVFTSVGSTTKYIKIYNGEDQRVLIDEISFADEFSEFFRMNVDGIQSQDKVEDITLLPNDSIYVFIETTIDPDQPNSISPFIIENLLTIKSGDRSDTKLIQAWGQNANYIPTNKQKSSISYLSCDFGEWVWDDPRPYVLYGSLIIDSCTWRLPAGTRVYVHGGIANNELGIYNDGLVILGSNAKIISEGSLDNPVSFRTDRLEESFQDDQGQWSGIILSSGSVGNELNHTQIYHSLVGIRADSATQLVINNSEIGHIGGNAVLGIQSNVDIFNTVLHNTGSHAVQFIQGGSYRMTHCTVYNPSSQNFGLSMTNFRCTDPLCQGTILVAPANGSFRNCLFAGFSSDQISFGDATDESGDLNYNFDHCVYSIDELTDEETGFPDFLSFTNNCLNIAYQADSMFINPDSFDFHLDTMAVAIDKGKVFSGFEFDKDGFMRDALPDVGCYEFQD